MVFGRNSATNRIIVVEINVLSKRTNSSESTYFNNWGPSKLEKTNP